MAVKSFRLRNSTPLISAYLGQSQHLYDDQHVMPSMLGSPKAEEGETRLVAFDVAAQLDNILRLRGA